MSDDSELNSADSSASPDPNSVEGLFIAALSHSSPEQRRVFLDEACGDDADRRRRIEALLLAYDDAGSFLERSPVDSPTAPLLDLGFIAPSDDPGLLGMLGPYEVLEVLGRGGMGIVFRARDPKLNRIVAIKVLAPELAANANARRRFLREAQAAAAISHPHVVTIHAVDDGSGSGSQGTRAATVPFLVMECVVGQTLQQKLDKQGSLRLRETLRIGHQIAEGLIAAHKQGLIHRDIKPANILLENGVERVKITDFGLARTVDDVSITRTGEVSGTPQYMSPEQANGELVDHRSDLFSLGCVLYSMCTGRSPFRATSLAAAIRRVCDDSPRPIDEINAEVPAWLIDIVNRLLDKNPDNRLQSADEVAALLAEQLACVQQPPGARATAAAVPLATAPSSVPSHRKDHQGLAVGVRLLLWLGAILLLVPLFIALGGTAVGAGGGAFEAAVITAVICIPGGVMVLAVALLDRSFLGLPSANAMFILLCIVLGPLGILLYLIRRDRFLTIGPDQSPARVANQMPQNNAGHPADTTGSAVEPSTLLAPKSGLASAAAAVLFVNAALVMGQAIEQWSDVSQYVGACLVVVALAVGAMALGCLRRARIHLTLLHWFTIGLASLPLLFFGAQGPSREFKRALAREGDLVGMVTAGVSLLAAMLMVALWSSRGSAPRSDSDPERRRNRETSSSPWRVLGWMIVAGFVLVPVSISTLLVVPKLAQAPPPSGLHASKVLDAHSVLVRYDNSHPVSSIFARSSLGDGRATRFDVTSNPFRFPLPRGVNDLTIVYQVDGQMGTIEKRVDVNPYRETMIDLRQEILADASGENLEPGDGRNLDEPINEEVGEVAAEPISSAVEEVQSNE